MVLCLNRRGALWFFLSLRDSGLDSTHKTITLLEKDYTCILISSILRSLWEADSNHYYFLCCARVSAQLNINVFFQPIFWIKKLAVLIISGDFCTTESCFNLLGEPNIQKEKPHTTRSCMTKHKDVCGSDN